MFEQFAKEWEFECSPSDPCHNQSNGKAESAVKIAEKLIKKTQQDGSDLWKAILDWRNTPKKEVGSSPTQCLMSRKTKTQLPTADALLKSHVETSVKEMLTMKHQRSQKYYEKTAHELPALREVDVVRMKPNPRDKTSKWCRGQIISKLGERSYLEDVNGRGYQRNQKSLHATSELPNTTLENTAEETLETVKGDIENKAVNQTPSKGDPLINKRCTAGAERSLYKKQQTEG